MPELVLWWYDHEWNVHWNVAADSVAAFQVAAEIAARLDRVTRISYHVNAPWEPDAPVTEATPDQAAATMADLWRREGQVRGSLLTGGTQYEISAITEGEGGQLSFQSADGIFGSRFDELVGILRQYATERNVRIAAPLQELSFGGSA